MARRLAGIATMGLILTMAAPGPVAAPLSAHTVAPSDAKKVIAVRAREIILALKARDVRRLSRFVHPVKGVRFSPYNYVSLEKNGDLVFTRQQIRTLLASKKRHLWGEYDGSGDPIRLTFAKYYRRFVYDHDYSRAKHVSYDDEMNGGGNLVNNIREAYPRAILVQYYFPGFDPKYGGMDWSSLWLVLEREGNAWYLVGIVHGEWTI